MIVSYTSQHSIFPGSVGSLLSQVQVRLLDAEGAEIQEYNVPGDLYVRSPSVMKGYLGENEEDSYAFDQDGWLVTGDVACMRRNTDGEEHLFIVDRKKDIMKVKVCLSLPGHFPVSGVVLLTMSATGYSSGAG